MRTNLTLAPEQFAYLSSVVRYRGNTVQPHGERFTWSDATTPRTERPARFGLSADWGAGKWRGFTYRQSTH